ncbi:MAG: hypothetical protein H2184_17000 [Candidatus Galacturonibacter soehngenii]|nr:hypothetical protein [Candidatus Galacturonibacter soehngenii]
MRKDNVMKWIEKFPKNVKPTYEELIEFFPERIRELFLVFDNKMASDYQVYNNYPRFDKTSGWKYGYCRKYRVELLSVTIVDDSFKALGITVKDNKSLNVLLEKCKAKYDDGYEERYNLITTAKKTNQMIRTKSRLEREKKELMELTKNINSSKFNKSKWADKVSRNKLIKLYQGEAKGLLDETLLDDIGYTFYTRCRQARDTREHLEKGEIICHFCGTVHKAVSYTALIACPCGYYYTYREYRRSCNANNVPGGRATEIFKAYTDNWLMCKSASEKMLLIDELVHECHVSAMTGVKGRSVCMNLVEGSLAQIKNMLEMLAGHE